MCQYTHTIPACRKLKQDGDSQSNRAFIFIYLKPHCLGQVSLHRVPVLPGSFPWVIFLSKAMTVPRIRPGTPVVPNLSLTHHPMTTPCRRHHSLGGKSGPYHSCVTPRVTEKSSALTKVTRQRGWDQDLNSFTNLDPQFLFELCPGKPCDLGTEPTSGTSHAPTPAV